jgi:hypothetical protein
MVNPTPLSDITTEQAPKPLTAALSSPISIAISMALAAVTGPRMALVYPFSRMNSASCSRPACSGKPAAWLAYDYGARCAWIDDHVEGAPDRSSRWPLCERHADTLQVPKGWSRVDRRSSALGAERADGAGFGDSADDGVVFPLPKVSSRIR